MMLHGVLLLVVVCVIWSVSSVVVQSVENSGVSALLLTYICNSLFVIYLAPRCLCPGRARSSNRRRQRHQNKELKAAAILSPLWMFANVSYNASLHTTSITSSTILATTSCLWTLTFSVVLGVERLTAKKFVGGVACVLGATLVAWGDTSNETVFGDILALASAALYGAYGTCLSYFHPLDSVLMFGYLGVCNAVFFAPVLFFSRQHFDKLTAPVLGLVLAKGLFDNALSDFLWAKAVVLTSPTVATIGLSLTIPVAFGIDAVAHNLQTSRTLSLALRALGAALVLASFILVTAAGDDQYHKHNVEDDEEEDLVVSSDEFEQRDRDDSSAGNQDRHHHRYENPLLPPAPSNPPPSMLLDHDDDDDEPHQSIDTPEQSL